MRWPFVEAELQNSNIVGWLTPILTLLACYHVGEPLFAGFVLLVGAAAGALLLSLIRRPWQQQVFVLLWAAAPIAFVVLELRISAYLDDSRSPNSAMPPRWHRSPRMRPSPQ